MSNEWREAEMKMFLAQIEWGDATPEDREQIETEIRRFIARAEAPAAPAGYLPRMLIDG